MDSYFCIVSLPAEPVTELCVLEARSDEAALREARRLALDWPAAATLRLYLGERLVGVLTGDLDRPERGGRRGGTRTPNQTVMSGRL